MRLTRTQVKHIAHLAHLSLSDEEIALYQDQLSAILVHAERLQDLDTDAIAPTAAILSIDSVMRRDESRPSMPQKDLMGNAPASAEGMLMVPPILD